jgi:TonB family protein
MCGGWTTGNSSVKGQNALLRYYNRPWLRLERYNRAMRMLCRFPLTASLLLCVLIGPCGGQESSAATRVQAERMEIPRYLPLARQAGVSGEVDLRLSVDKAGKVVSVEVVSAGPNRWGKGFASMAIEAAKKSEFVCASCSGDTFGHTVTYQFQFPPIPKDACTQQPPPPLPASAVDSDSHVTVRPSAWPCVQD